jgi:NADPH:quinone reductase-like Zn-dependent oxidoreductase
MSSPSATSQAYRIHILDPARDYLSPNTLNNLTLETIPKPIPGPSSVLVRIRAVTLNFRDILIAAGSPLYPISSIDGIIPCADGAGEIVGVGENSTWNHHMGQNVIVVPQKTWIDGDIASYGGECMGGGSMNGTLAQYVVMPDECVIPMPKNITFGEAASLVVAGATAMNVLSTIEIKKGMTVVTQGTGGTSCFVMQVSVYPKLVSVLGICRKLIGRRQLAAALGARVIATSSTDEKLQVAKQLGASDLINYKTTPEWAAEVLRLTDGKGADLVADVGGSGTVEQSVKALRMGGTACLIGFLTPPHKNDVVMPLITGAKSCKILESPSSVQ